MANLQGNSGLACEACGLGYADCNCVPAWTDEGKRKQRQSEIRTVKGAVLRDLGYRQGPSTTLQRVRLSLPLELLAALERVATVEQCSVSTLVGALLCSHSGSTEPFRVQLSRAKRISLTLPKRTWQRLRRRAKLEESSVSRIAAAHLWKEILATDEN